MVKKCWIILLLKRKNIYVVGDKAYFIIPNYRRQFATFPDLFIFTDALHVSGGSSAHHQEHTTTRTASGICNYITMHGHMNIKHILSVCICFLLLNFK
jgi:hypothetical protein